MPTKNSMTLALLLTCLPICAWAENVSDVRDLGGGMYSMKIGGKDYVAMSASDSRQLQTDYTDMKQKLGEATQKLKEYQSLTSQYEELRGKYANLTTQYDKLAGDSIQLNERYKAADDNLLALAQKYSGLTHDYDALTEKYRDVAVRSIPREPLDVGVGAVNSNSTTRGVVMVGAGTHVFNKSVRAWLFGGQNNYGMVVGTSF